MGCRWGNTHALTARHSLVKERCVAHKPKVPHKSLSSTTSFKKRGEYEREELWRGGERMEERIGVCCSVVVGEVREGVKMKNGRKV